jgi:hypothetical protein
VAEFMQQGGCEVDFGAIVAVQAQVEGAAVQAARLAEAGIELGLDVDVAEAGAVVGLTIGQIVAEQLVGKRLRIQGVALAWLSEDPDVPGAGAAEGGAGRGTGQVFPAGRDVISTLLCRLRSQTSATWRYTFMRCWPSVVPVLPPTGLTGVGSLKP